MKNNKSKKKIWILVVSIAVVVAVIFLVIPKNETKDFDSSLTTRGDITKYIVGTATIMAPDTAYVTAQFTGEVRVTAENGSTVKEKDTVVKVGTFEMKAPFDGEVNILVKDGDKVQPGDQLFSIINLEKIKVQGTINEKDILKIALGQEVTITLNSTTDTFNGKVTNIFKDGTQSLGSTVYTIETTIEGDLSKVYPSMSGDVKIETGKVENVVKLDMDFLQFEGKKPFVLMKVDGKIEKIYVEVGFSDGAWVEIKNLESGSEILMELKKNSMLDMFS